MRAKPSSSTRSGKSNTTAGKSNGANPKVIKKSKEAEKKKVPDLSILRQPVDTSVSGLKAAVKVFETGTPEILHLLTYDCDVVYECKVCRNLFRSIANFISHKRVYCTLRYSRAQDLSRTNNDGEDLTLILSEKVPEKLPTRITARKDLTSILESLSGVKATPAASSGLKETRPSPPPTNTVHLEPMENSAYGVFQTVLKPDNQNLMRNQVAELQDLVSQNEAVLGPDGRILQNRHSSSPYDDTDTELNDENGLNCSICNIKFANRKTLAKHKKVMHEATRTSYSCPCCKNLFSNPWSVYRHLYKVHRKTNEQVRRLRTQIHKKDIRVDAPVNSNFNNKKAVSPSKKKTDTNQHLKIHQDNKEWMDHLEDNWELQRCGGCGRKFERKAALISHSQICQKRIAAYNRIEQNHQALVPISSLTPVVALSPMQVSKKPIPKPSPEKKIGIQVRMNYCKISSGGPVSQSHVMSQQARSVRSDDSDIETITSNGKDQFFPKGLVKPSLGVSDGYRLEQPVKQFNKCRVSESLENVSSILNDTAHSLGKVHTYEISTCKRSTVVRSTIGKNKGLEAKCLQLRSALENGIVGSLKNSKEKDLDHVYFDSHNDSTSESNTSAISSLSSQLTPLIDKGHVCEVEQSSIEIKNINITRTVGKIPRTEADSTSMPVSTHMTYNSRTVRGNIKVSPDGKATCEVSTSVISDQLPSSDSRMHADSSCITDDEISMNLKPIGLQENELEYTMAILTRNQLKAICQEDPMPPKDEKNISLTKDKRENEGIINENYREVEATTKTLLMKRLSKYIDYDKIQCKICNQRYTTKYNAFRHIVSHTRWSRYKCLFNSCAFKAFSKQACLNHAKIHDTNKSSDALVGLINPRKWNLRLLEAARVSFSQTSNKGKKQKTIGKGQILSVISAKKKLIKPVKRISQKSLKTTTLEKSRTKPAVDMQKDTVKRKITNISKETTKQRLLTDYKHFSETIKLNEKNIPHNTKVQNNPPSPKKKEYGNCVSTKTLLSSNVQKNSVLQNGIAENHFSPSGTEIPGAKKQRRCFRIQNSAEDSKVAIARSVEQPNVATLTNHMVKAEDNRSPGNSSTKEIPGAKKQRSSLKILTEEIQNSAEHSKDAIISSVKQPNDAFLTNHVVKGEDNYCAENDSSTSSAKEIPVAKKQRRSSPKILREETRNSADHSKVAIVTSAEQNNVAFLTNHVDKSEDICCAGNASSTSSTKENPVAKKQRKSTKILMQDLQKSAERSKVAIATNVEQPKVILLTNHVVNIEEDSSAESAASSVKDTSPKLVKKPIHESWDVEAMNNAILAVRSGMDFCVAARHFSVPKNALKKKVFDETIDISEDLLFLKGRGSRTNSRKSSINSTEQLKAKSLTPQPVKVDTEASIKVEDSILDAKAPANNDSQSSVHIQSSEIVDGSSAEEEESQESDKPVDDSHLKKIFMEVIFGPTDSPLQGPAPSLGRPVRTKTKPKRNSDYLPSYEKIHERENTTSKSSTSKKKTKSQSLPEVVHDLK